MKLLCVYKKIKKEFLFKKLAKMMKKTLKISKNEEL